MESDHRYPIGRWSWPTTALTDAQRRAAIRDIAETPHNIRAAVKGLSEKQLDMPYRPGGWTVRQVAHHLPDSHLNAYTRFKLALTEDNPVIKPYEEAEWAKLPDSKLPVEHSLAILDAVHARLDAILRSLTEEQWARPFLHPASGPQTIDVWAALYAWHSRHHTAHVTALREREKF
jgi:hypothetical protein